MTAEARGRGYAGSERDADIALRLARDEFGNMRETVGDCDGVMAGLRRGGVSIARNQGRGP